MDIVYTDDYYADIGEHLFPMEKYKLVREVLTAKGEFGIENFEDTDQISDENLLRFHTADFLTKLKTNALTAEDVDLLEMPFSEKLYKSMRYHAGGTLKAARIALRDGIACNLGGGFHHAHSDHAEALCLINDVGIAAQTLLDEGAVKKILILDLDVHQGNGTACFFKHEKRVMCFSIHAETIYPLPKEKAGMNIGLAANTDDDYYLDTLRSYYFALFNEFCPDIVFYNAGADVYAGDLVGKLGMTINGIRHRDESVFFETSSRGIPIATVLGGGYSKRVEDLITIHANTIRAADNAAVIYRRKACGY